MKPLLWGDNWLTWKFARFRCRALRQHTATCRGRTDHVRDGQIIDPGRWAA